MTDRPIAVDPVYEASARYCDAKADYCRGRTDNEADWQYIARLFENVADEIRLGLHADCFMIDVDKKTILKTVNRLENERDEALLVIRSLAAVAGKVPIEDQEPVAVTDDDRDVALRLPRGDVTAIVQHIARYRLSIEAKHNG